MDDAFYDGHDELYHHAKFGEDCCRCENMVSVLLLVMLRVLFVAELNSRQPHYVSKQ